MKNRQYAQFNCYDALNISPSASPGEIKKAHRQASLKSHPDRGGSHEAQIKVNLAYEILSDPVERQAHDLFWKIGSKTYSYKKSSNSQKHKSESSSYPFQQGSNSNEPLAGLKQRFYEEVEKQKDSIWKSLNERVSKNEKIFAEAFQKGKKGIGASFLYGLGWGVAAYISQVPLLYIGTAICSWSVFSKLQGIEIAAQKFSIFDVGIDEKIKAHARTVAQDECKNQINNIDSRWSSIALLAELLMRPSSFDDSEEQVARRITASFFLMGYRPAEYYQDHRILTFTDGEERIVVRFRHRTGQAMNITYVKALTSVMSIIKADRAFLFCSPGLSGNAADYARQFQIKWYSLDDMNTWIEQVLRSDYNGPSGDLFEGIDNLISFIKRIYAVISPYKKSSRRKRHRRY